MKNKFLIKNAFLFGLLFFTASLIHSEADISNLGNIMFAAVKVPILIIDPETTLIVDANKEAVDFYGYKYNDIKKMYVSDINTLEKNNVLKEIDAAAEEKRKYFEFKHKLASGEIRDVEVYSSPVEYKNKKFLVSIIHDITARKEIENKLVKSESRLSDAESFARFGHWIFDLDNGTVFASEGAKQIYGISGEEWTIPNIQTVPLKKYREKLDNALQDLIKKNTPYDLKFKIKRKNDGKIVDIESIAEYDREKNIVFGIIQDITKEEAYADLLKRRTAHFIIFFAIVLMVQFIIILLFIRVNNQKNKAQSALLEKSKEFDRFFSLKSDLLCVLDKKGNFLRVNSASENILGFPSEVSENRNLYDLMDERDADNLKDTVSKIKKDGDSKSTEVRIGSGNDEDRIIEWKISLYGNLLYGIARDITERKKEEEKRFTLEKQILHTQKLESLGVLAGGIAHDFNNILMAVLGHAELALMDIKPSSSSFSNLKEIEKASKKASKLCSQMLTYTGRSSYELEKVNINSLIEDMIHLVKTIITKKAVLNISLQENISYINADPSQISQVIMNLIINSSDAIGDKKGVISISTGSSVFDSEYLSKTELFNELVPGKYVYFEISDTGCGISPEEKDRIFEPFFTTKFTGRGLGLSAVLGIVRSHRGSIKIYSEKGRGSNFKVLIPAADNGENDKEIDEGMKKNEAWKGSGTVLFVDDEESLRLLGSSMLANIGYNVITAVDGADAVEIFKKRYKEIDLVILDLTMPNMDGSQAFSEIRNIKEDIKVIIASGYSFNDITARFSGKRLVGIIQKPYTIDKMREILKNL